MNNEEHHDKQQDETSIKSQSIGETQDMAEIEKGLSLDPEPATSDAKTSEVEEYSAFTDGEKKAIILAASFASWFSPMTGSIYVRKTERSFDLADSSSSQHSTRLPKTFMFQIVRSTSQ